MRAWVNLLPLFVVKILARRHCEKVKAGYIYYHTATPDVLIAAKRAAKIGKAKEG